MNFKKRGKQLPPRTINLILAYKKEGFYSFRISKILNISHVTSKKYYDENYVIKKRGRKDNNSPKSNKLILDIIQLF